MYKASITGRVFPEIPSLTILPPQNLSYKQPDWPHALQIWISVDNNALSILFETETSDHLTKLDLIIIGGDAARAMIDTTGFIFGISHTVILDRISDNSGLNSYITPEFDKLKEYCTAFSPNTIVEDFRLVVESRGLALALNDLLQGASNLHWSTINCTRAVEGIRHLIAGEGESPEKAWPIMRTALNIDRSFIQLVTSSSVENRHGNRTIVPASTNHEIARRAWIIMDRYLHYLKRQRVPLTAPDFPLLS